MYTKTLIDAVGQNPKLGQMKLTASLQPSTNGNYGRLSRVLLQLTVPPTAKNGIVLQAQGSLDGTTFGNLIHRRFDDGTWNATPTYLPSATPYLLEIGDAATLAAVRFQYKTAGPTDPSDACVLLGPDRS